MSGDTKVASRYANALFETVIAANELDAVSADLQSLDAVFGQTPELAAFLENPAVSLEEKNRFVQEQLANQVHPIVARLLGLLVEHQRMASFSLLVKEFLAACNKRNNTGEAELVTASELDDELIERVRQSLQSRFGFNRVEIKHHVDPGLLGGMIVRLNDQVIDGSYVGRLEQLRKQLTKV